MVTHFLFTRFWRVRLHIYIYLYLIIYKPEHKLTQAFIKFYSFTLNCRHLINYDLNVNNDYCVATVSNDNDVVTIGIFVFVF